VEAVEHREVRKSREWLFVAMRYVGTEVARVHTLLLAKNQRQSITHA
jgi:hypothetical protein